MRYKRFSPEQKLAIVEQYLQASGAKHRHCPTVGEICLAHGINRSHLKVWLGRLRARAGAVYDRPEKPEDHADAPEERVALPELATASDPENQIEELEAANERLHAANQRLLVQLTVAKRHYGELLHQVRIRLPKFRPMSTV